MADEPNTRMDEMLKAYAAKRRQDAGAPFEMHPATRQMLKGEVARTYKQVPPRASWLQRVITFWPRMAFAAACVAITVTLVLFVMPRQKMMEMAQSTAPAREEDRVTRDSRLTDKEQAAAETLNGAYADAPAPSAPAPSTAPVMPANPLDRLAKEAESADVKAKSELMAEARKDGAVKLMRDESLERQMVRQSDSNIGNTSRARYVQQKQDVQLGAKVANAQTVLDNFELEQRGNEIRITDQDGSVYVGNMISQDEAKKRAFRVQNVPQATQPGQAVAVTGSAAGVAGPAPSPTLFFAFGTNVSLKQEVSIEGNILQLTTNMLATPAFAPSRALNEENRRSGSNIPQNAIQGRARVGTNQEVFINAVPAQP